MTATRPATLGLLPHLRRARDHIDRHFEQPLHLDELASVAGVSKFHFVRSFEATYGETPIRYLTRRRIPMGEDFRWVTVNHPNQPELEVTFMKPGPPLDPDAADFVRRRLEKGQMGGLGLNVDDCRKTCDELSAKGVTFLQEPSDRPYGVEAVMRDNSGNWLVLVEPKEFTPEDFA